MALWHVTSGMLLSEVAGEDVLETVEDEGRGQLVAGPDLHSAFSGCADICGRRNQGAVVVSVTDALLLESLLCELDLG